ncbi:Uncharacterised protein [Mycobacteroides abscessus subsp. abscessus]|nr:Uncharacterised protein [Mycobacteroides abscessus subsp. abscessus]
MKKIIAILSIITVITGLTLITAGNHEAAIHKTAGDKNVTPGG